MDFVCYTAKKMEKSNPLKVQQIYTNKKEMMGRRVLSMLQSYSTVAIEEGKGAKKWGEKLVSGALLCVTGGVALSALDDLVVFHGCTSKAMEKASTNKPITEAIGEPIVRGPWYNASLAVAHKRQSVSCTFPVSGPRGTAKFQLKAVRNGEGNWFSILRPADWEILVMDALLHVPDNDKKEQTFRISVLDNPVPPQPSNSCTACISQPSAVKVENQPQPT